MPQSKITTSGDLANAILDLAWDHFDKVRASAVSGGDEMAAYEVMCSKVIDLLEGHVLLGSTEDTYIVDAMAVALYGKFAKRELLADVLAGRDDRILPFAELSTGGRQFWIAMARTALAAQARGHG